MSLRPESPANRGPMPPLNEFIAWPAEKVRDCTEHTTVLLSTSGTSRWYFLEHGDMRLGYHDPKLFEEYGRLVIDRVTDIASYIYGDGVKTLFITGFAGGQGDRDKEYQANMRWVYRLLADDTTAVHYDRHQIGVKFRGNWPAVLHSLKAEDLSADFQRIEQQTERYQERRLIWYVQDDYIPRSLMALVQEAAGRGELPDHQDLVKAYYGQAIGQIDILIGNNKPSLPAVSPPLLTVKDLYFTVSPITYLEHATWRRILYDHLFARKGHYRDFQTMVPEVTDEMRHFYRKNQAEILGIGNYHEPSQSWRPTPWYASADSEP